MKKITEDPNTKIPTSIPQPAGQPSPAPASAPAPGPEGADGFPPKPAPSETQVTRVLIVGISGYIGSSLALGLREKFEVFGTYNQRAIRMDGTSTFQMNATNTSEIVDVMKRCQPDVIIYAAGVSDVDAAQKDKDRTETLHIKAPSMILKTGARPPHFIYFSSDQVYGDIPETVKPPLSEKTLTNPINALGISKLQGENMALGLAKGSHVFRLGPVFGESFGSVNGMRRTWIAALRRKLERKDRILLPVNQIRSHLYVGDFVRAIYKFLGSIPGDSGIYNLAPKDSMGLGIFGKSFARALGFDDDLVRFSDGEDSLSLTNKGKNSSLSSKKFETHYEFNFQTVDDSILEYAERLRVGNTASWNLHLKD